MLRHAQRTMITLSASPFEALILSLSKDEERALNSFLLTVASGS